MESVYIRASGHVDGWLKKNVFAGDSGGDLEEMSGMIDGQLVEDDDDDDDDEEDTEDDFRERVAWQSKYDAKACFLCGSAFNPITNRHHHCRACGRVVCGKCSTQKDKVKGYSKRQRTCDECHEQLANQFTLKKVLGLLCPCLKLLKREMKKAREAHMLYDGAVFIRKGQRGSVGKIVKGFFGQKKNTESKDGDEESSSRVKVKLRSDGLALTIAPIGGFLADAEEVYFHDVRSIDAKGSRGISIIGSSDAVLFQGDMTDKSLRDEWLKALSTASVEAKAKPPPARTQSTASRVKFATRRARKEIELQSKKRDAEQRKASYLKGSKGLKYTALAMAERDKNNLSSGDGDLV